MSKDPGHSDSKADCQGSRIRKIETENKKLRAALSVATHGLEHYQIRSNSAQSRAQDDLIEINKIMDRKMKKYSLEIINAGEETYALMSLGHHDLKLFALEVKKHYPTWPMSIPEHSWYVRAPRAGYSSYYYPCSQDHKRSIPMTCCHEDCSQQAKTFYNELETK